MKLYCTICDAWVLPVMKLLAWHCPGCGAELQLDPEREALESDDDTEDF